METNLFNGQTKYMVIIGFVLDLLLIAFDNIYSSQWLSYQ